MVTVEHGCISIGDGTINAVIVSARPVVLESETSFIFEGKTFELGDNVIAGGGGLSPELIPDEFAQIEEACGEFQRVMRLSTLTLAG